MEKKENNETLPRKANSLSIAGFVCSLCGLITCGITSIIGLILSIIGLSNSKKEGKQDGLAIAGIVISTLFLSFNLFFLFAGSLSGTDSSASTSEKSNGKEIRETNKNDKKTYIKIDVDTLEEELEKNAAAAKDTYKDQYIEITGKLGTIDSDLKYISLDSPTKEWDFNGIHCTIRNSETKEVVKTLTRGQTITVKGKITDVGEVLGYYLNIDEIIPQ